MSFTKLFTVVACCASLVFAAGCDDDDDDANTGGTGGAVVADGGTGGTAGAGGEDGTAGAGGEAGMGGEGGTAGAGGEAGMGGEGGAALSCEAVDAPCEDESILALNLFDTVNPAAIANTETDGVWTSDIDAAAGGMNTTMSYVYARFTDTGLEKVELGDEDAFVSMDWDIAIRRYMLRLNSGVGGPSCVTGARTRPDTDFAALAELPPGVTFHEEQYMTESCEPVPDGSGLGSPATVLSSFWTYNGCVKMTGHTYILELANSRLVKLKVDHYYAPDNQALCQDTDSAGPMGGNNPAQVGLSWAFIN